MLRRMIGLGSARSLLTKEHGADDMSSEMNKTSSATRRNDLKSNVVDGFWHGDRPTKRIMLATAGSRRLTRSRSSVEHCAQGRGENGLVVALPAPAAANVLGDVTNIANSMSHRMSKDTKDVESKTQCFQSADEVIADVDPELLDPKDPQQVAEYANDIFRLLHREEHALLPQATYMDKQPHVNGKMRAILIDWLVDVAKKYKLKSETLFLAVALVDRFLELRETQRQHLQLVGVTGLLLAAKFEETCPPQVQDFVYVTDSAYSKEEVMKMEVAMLTALNFQLCQPTAFHFLQWFQKTNVAAEVHQDLAQYMLELALVDYKMIRHPPSHQAAAAVLLSNKLLRRQPAWTPTAVKQTEMTEQMLKCCMKDIRCLLNEAEHSSLQAVRKKYSHAKFGEVAKQPFLKEVSNCILFGDVPAATATKSKPGSAVRRSASAAMLLDIAPPPRPPRQRTSPKRLGSQGVVAMVADENLAPRVRSGGA